jgi:hypothetical protein
VVTPRTNAALISPAENMCGALTLHTGGVGGGPVALEMVADGERSRFLIRTQTAVEQRQLRGQTGAAYPQATLRSLEAATLPTGDPVCVGAQEQISCYTMVLRAGDHLRSGHSITVIWIPTPVRRRPTRCWECLAQSTTCPPAGVR